MGLPGKGIFFITMKLNDNFIIYNTGRATLLVPLGTADFHGLVQGNKSVDTILNCLLSETSEEMIVQAMIEKYDGDEDDIRTDVASVLSQLRAIGAIDE